jgi:hypothetical protein
MPSLLATVAAIVSHTTIWLWALYALLLLPGFQRTHDSTVPLPRLLILPIAQSPGVNRIVIEGSAPIKADSGKEPIPLVRHW